MITDICILNPRNYNEYNFIKNVLLKRRYEQYGPDIEDPSIYNKDGSFNISCFRWDSSKEGWSFWDKLSSEENEPVVLSVEIAKMWNEEFSKNINSINKIEESDVYEITNLSEGKYFITIEKE